MDWLEEKSFGEREMIQGFMDGGDRDAPRPSSNRSLSYRWGFTNRLRDRGVLPPHRRSVDRVRKLAERIIERDNRRPCAAPVVREGQ